MKKFLKINCTNRVPLGVPICFIVFSANYGKFWLLHARPK